MLPRRFSPDPFRPARLDPHDLRDHRVVETILRRRDEGSRPGARSDGRRVALVIEGGGMRGVVSAGMTAAIEQLGLRDAFDEVHGASAGAFNAAFLLAGQAAYLATLYQYGFGDPRFVSFVRALRGGAAFDMDHVIDQVWTRERPLRFEAILSGKIDLHCTATDADRATIVDLTDLRDEEQIRCALRASARLPWLAGRPVSFRGMRLLDATLAEAIPVHAACSSATDVLVLQTRPEGVRHAGLSPVVARLTDRYLQAINPALVELRVTRSPRYDALAAELAAQAQDPDRAPAMCVIRPAGGSVVIGQLESRASMLQRAASQGMRSAWMALAGEDPELIGTLRAYPWGDAGVSDARGDAGVSDARGDAGVSDARGDTGVSDTRRNAGVSATRNAGVPDARADAGVSDARGDAGVSDTRADAGVSATREAGAPGDGQRPGVWEETSTIW